MCFGDLRKALLQQGLRVSDMQIRWAMSSGKVQRPPLDGSLRFDFSPEHVVALRDYFLAKGCSGGRRKRKAVVTVV
jgi:hypothetical protein